MKHSTRSYDDDSIPYFHNVINHNSELLVIDRVMATCDNPSYFILSVGHEVTVTIQCTRWSPQQLLMIL